MGFFTGITIFWQKMAVFLHTIPLRINVCLIEYYVHLSRALVMTGWSSQDTAGWGIMSIFVMAGPVKI